MYAGQRVRIPIYFPTSYSQRMRLLRNLLTGSFTANPVEDLGKLSRA
jgi:hypothetical protein